MQARSTGEGDTAYWDTIAEQHDGLPAGWRRHSRRAHLALFREWVDDPRGRWLKTDLFEERDPVRSLPDHLPGPHWVGIDLSVQTAATARAPSDRAAADVRALPFPDECFDGVLSTSTLDHFDDRAEIDRALAELRRLLRTGGLLVLTLDNARQPLIRLRNALPPRVARRTGLVPFAVGETLDVRAGRHAIEEAGFHVRATGHLLHAPHVVGTRLARFERWERRALPWFDRLGRTPAAPLTGHFVAFLAERA